MDEAAEPAPAKGGGVEDPMSVLAKQLADLAERLRSSGAAALAPFTSPGWPGGPESQAAQAATHGLLAQAALPAQQLESALAEIKARREQVEAMRAQLATFDEQLAALETTLRPLVEWSAAWARLVGGGAAD